MLPLKMFAVPEICEFSAILPLKSKTDIRSDGSLLKKLAAVQVLLFGVAFCL